MNINHEIERNEATVKALLMAFSGSSYTVRVQGYAGVYTITRWPDNKVVTVTQAEIAEREVGQLVGAICAEWSAE